MNTPLSFFLFFVGKNYFSYDDMLELCGQRMLELETYDADATVENFVLFLQS
jgi:hypothetical protein